MRDCLGIPHESLIPLFEGFSGRLICSPEIVLVSMDFQRLIRESTKCAEALLQLDPRQFEEFIAELWQRFGYEVELTKRTRDGGYDIVAVKRGAAAVRFLIECKRYDPTNKVGVSIVRELYGVKTHRRATKGIVATTSFLTADAQEFIDDHYWELEAKDHWGVIEWAKMASVVA
jgi:restriction system protein